MYDLLTSLSHLDWISELEGDRCMIYLLVYHILIVISGFRGDRCMIYLQVYHPYLQVYQGDKLVCLLTGLSHPDWISGLEER